MIFEWLHCFIPLSGVWALARLSYRYSGSWGAPPSLFCGFWAFISTLHLIAVPDVHVWPPVFYFILMMVFAVFWGQILAGRHRLHSGVLAPQGLPNKATVKIIRLMVGMCFLMGLLGFATLVMSSPLGVRSLQSPQAFAEMAQHYSTLRYRGHSEPLLFRLAMSVHYLGCFCAGLLLVLRDRRTDLVFVSLPFAVGVLVTLSLTTKAALLFTILLFLSAYLASKVSYFPGKSRRMSRQLVFGLGGFGIAILILFVGVQMVRYESTSLSDGFRVFNRLRLDFLGFLGPISVWARTYIYDPYIPGLGFGVSTFSGPLSLVFPLERKTGIFSDSVVIGFGQHTSNIYTFMRTLILDFGVAGSLIFLSLVGFVGQSVFNKIMSGRRMLHPLLAGFFLNTLWSHVTMAFNYNSLVIAWVAYSAIVFWLARTSNSKLISWMESRL